MSELGRVCVVGDGLGGNAFARRLLELRPETDLTLFGAEPVAAYNRVLLPDVLAGRTDRGLLDLPAPVGEKLVIRTGTRVIEIDRERRELRTDDGGVTAYDTLVLAMGANPVLPAISGLRDLRSEGGIREGVYTLRTVADLDELRPAALRSRRAVVIGGGVLGVQCARALISLGPAVELLHQGTHLLDHRIDDVAGSILARTLTFHGVEVHTESRVTNILAGEDGRAGGVRLADGKVLDCDLVLFACGAAPASALAERCGLAVRADVGGVVVDDWLRSTTDPRVYAIGDCAAPRAGVWPGLAAPALAQAEFLATRLAGRPTRRPRYESAASVIRLGGDGIDLALFGTASERAEPADGRTVRLVDPVKRSYRSVTVHDDRLLGAVLIGEVAAASRLGLLLDHPTPLPPDPLSLLLSPLEEGPNA